MSALKVLREKLEFSTTDLSVMIAIAASTGLLFIVDLQLSKGTLDGYPYVIPLIGAMFMRTHYAAFPIAAALAFVAIIGHFHSDHEGPTFEQGVVGIVNVSIAIVALFGTAAAIEHGRRSRVRLMVRLQQLQNAEEQRNRIMSIIAHDLRSPLNPIIGFASMIAGTGGRLSDEKLKEYGETIATSGERLLATLDRLLTWARSPSADAHISPVATDLSALVSDAAGLLQPVAARKDIRIVANLAPLSVYCDPVMMSTVVRNLIGNAIKFSRAGQTVTVKADAGPVSATLSVVDQGIGMTESLVQKLATGKLATSTVGTAGESGTGLGLRICRSLVEQNNGMMGFSSIRDQGTTVSVTIPRVVVPGSARHSP